MLRKRSKTDSVVEPSSCAISIHGCCPDGVTASSDLYGSNCARSAVLLSSEIPCKYTAYGCCKDGVTSSQDWMGSNCPMI